MPRIVRFHQTGGPEVLKIESVDIPPPKEGEVEIQVKAIGLNRAESMFRSGKYLEEPHFPSRLGYEAAGVVKAVGKGVTDFKPGDIVSNVPIPSLGQYGVYGEVATIPQKYVVKHPANLSFIDASAVWMQYLTSYGALIDIANLKIGDFCLITAASSSVGLASIQLANLVGATPIALTRTSEKKQALLDAGAKHVIATQEEDVVKKVMQITKNQGARVVFDAVAGPQVAILAEAMCPQGILFLYGALSTEPTPFPLFTALSKSLTIRGYVLFEILNDPVRFEKAKHFTLDALKAGKLKPIIAKTFPLDQIVEAHRFLESNKQFGKIVVTV